MFTIFFPFSLQAFFLQQSMLVQKQSIVYTIIAGGASTEIFSETARFAQSVQTSSLCFLGSDTVVTGNPLCNHFWL